MERDPTRRRALVVYESMFVNTAAVARAIGDGLGTRFDAVEVVDVSAAPLALDAYDLVVVGGPTHAFGPSRPGTRRSAREQGSGAPDRGVREWLAELSAPATPAPAAAAFDTRLQTWFPTGSAARGIRRRLRRLGFRVGATTSFDVAGTAGPLVTDALEAARRFGASIPAPSPTSVAR
ncbi:MAG TPA: hypothetical protein VFT09_00885 [Ilumatobacteraceae bacterium]|nr:hypothetical protein [Ilumatobacteraceae bacterium]